MSHQSNLTGAVLIDSDVEIVVCLLTGLRIMSVKKCKLHKELVTIPHMVTMGGIGLFHPGIGVI
jgi:hypothetical protein